MIYTYHVVVERDAHQWRAYCPAFESYQASTGGETREEALTHIHSVLFINLGQILAQGAPVPADVHLNAGIRHEVIKGFKRNAKPEIHSNMVNVPVELVTASLDVGYHFSGNVDARLIRDVATSYGFSVETDAARTRGGSDLLIVKTQRNDLAHGDKTYDEVGRDFTARDLLEIGLRTMAYVEGILANVAEYLDKQGYRMPISCSDAPKTDLE